MLKKISKIVLPLIILLFVIIFFVGKNNKSNKILLLGDNKDYKNFIQEELEIRNISNDVDNSYTYEDMKSSDLLYYATNNAVVNSKEGKISFNDMIKSSSIVCLSIGYIDVLSKITISRYERNISYDKEELELMFSRFEQNLFHIVEHIRLISEDIPIIITGYDDAFYFLEENDANHSIIKTLNDIIKDICYLFDITYVDFSLTNVIYYGDEFSLYPNEFGKRKNAKNLTDKIIAILENI